MLSNLSGKHIILVMGLPGSGKTTFCERIMNRYPEMAMHLNADVIREQYNDWDFSIEGRIRQAKRMRKLAEESPAPTVYIDMICPLKEMRQIIRPNTLVFIDRIKEGRYPDTNALFERPSPSECHSFVLVTEDTQESHQWLRNDPDVSCVMSTYGRFSCVERSIKFFLDQTKHLKKELIILNTDVEHPLVLGQSLFPYYHQIKIINSNTNIQTGKDYDNIGAIRRDALFAAKGKYYICWDDDDIFLPWNVQQCYDNIESLPTMDAWKPYQSMWWGGHMKTPALARNVMEASIISRTDKIKEIGFISHPGGGEHLSWVNHLNKNRKMFIDNESLPAYCFNWSDTGIVAGHKQSGSIDRVDNFAHHKLHTKDHATRPLELLSDEDVKKYYDPHIKLLKDLVAKDWIEPGYKIHQELIDKYIK